jgi:putative membrane protein
MRVDKFINEAGRKAIESAVASAESNTSGEIVPVVVGASSTYDWIGYRAAFLGWLAASLVTLWLHYSLPFALDYWGIYACQLGGIALGWAFSRTSWGLHLLVSEKAMEEEVGETALSAFVKNGLMNTRSRTGVLIFVSLKEHRVQILGDKGIHEKVGEGFWRAEAQQIVQSIRAGRPAEGLVKAIADIGEKLKAHFPRAADDKNELGDHMRTE